MSCSSSTICSHLSLPSCSSSSSRSSNFYRDVKTMFIARDNTLPNQTHQLQHPPETRPIWTVAYSSSSIDPCGPYYADPETLESHRNHHNFSPKSKRDPSSLQSYVSENNAKRKALFLFIIPLLFIVALLAVYHVIHMQKDLFLVNSSKIGVKETTGNSFNPNRSHRDSVYNSLSSDVTGKNYSTTSFDVGSFFKGPDIERKSISAQFRISNKIYNRQLKNKTSEPFQKFSRELIDTVKHLIYSRKQLRIFELNRIDLLTLRKGDNPKYNLNGIIVDLVLHFNRNVSCSLNEFALNLLSAKHERHPSGFEIEDKTLGLKFSSNHTPDVFEIENDRYRWDKWSDWGPPCKNEQGYCDEDRVHSRARNCFDKHLMKTVDETLCIQVYKAQHQSLQIEDCICEEEEDKCLEDEWKCLNSQCIPLNKRCDGHMNCYDESDEKNCICKENEVHCGQNTSCIAIEKRCDNIPDCWDTSDELGCPGYVDYS